MKKHTSQHIQSMGVSERVVFVRSAVDEKERKEYIDPFQGMPEAAGVILEIIEDLAKKASK